MQRWIHWLLAVGRSAVIVMCLLTSCISDEVVRPVPVEPGETEAPQVDLDVLYIGAHPDDEAFDLATLGQWIETDKLRIGVVTLTRGEGGGNAVGPEEGPPLGLLREGEERRAVAMAGIAHIYYLDKVDFYYTVSAPLTGEVWKREPTLEKLVRLVRTTRPEVIITLDPSPTPGNHGHHQYAARLAVEAFHAAADEARFPAQIAGERLDAWRAGKLLRWSYLPAGAARSGPDCAAAYVPADPTEETFGVWSGTRSERWGKAWIEVERDAQREYATQGWSVWPDAPTDPSEIGCEYHTLVDSRVPYTAGNTATTAALEGALLPAAGGLPLGTELYLTTDRFQVLPGQAFEVVAHVRNPLEEAWEGATVALTAPTGWRVEGSGSLDAVERGAEAAVTFTVTPAADAAQGRHALAAALRVGDAAGTTREAVEVVPEVRGSLQPLAAVEEFRAWAAEVGAPGLDSLLATRASLGVGETSSVGVDLQNFSAEVQSGTVSLALPAGFEASPATLAYDDLAPGEARRVTFEITNTDAALETANAAEGGGDYPIQVSTSSLNGEGTEAGALNLVPVAVVPEALAAPVVDGEESDGEYAGAPIDVSRVWEGAAPSSAADASGTAKVTWSGDALYVVLHVSDDVLGAVLPRSDTKRHWRTDSVEVAIDPRGDSENTATTFKVGAFPTTEEGPAAATRDADNHPGPVGETAPGFEVAARITEPYAGYTLEMRIPFDALPAAPDPERMGLNLFVYDSDSQDRTGQTRLGWSTWGGVKGDPYRWGHASLEGYGAPAREPRAPTLPLDVARSVTSPQTLLQSTEDHVAPGLEATALPEEAVSVPAPPEVTAEGVKVSLEAAGTGEAHVFVWAGGAPVARATRELAAGSAELTLPIAAEARATVAEDGVVVIGWQAESGRTTALAAPLAQEP
ncbi:sugar-binding protein [Sorangium sp. So ce134]